MVPLFNCTEIVNASITALIISALVFKDEPPLKCPEENTPINEIARIGGILNCSNECDSPYELAVALSNEWSPEFVPPPLPKIISQRLQFSDITLILILTFIVGVAFFAFLKQSIRSSL